MIERTVIASGRAFRYLERAAAGPTLVFLHGLGDTADQFEPVAACLPEDWHLLALDQRGHGGSFKPDAGYTPFDFAEDVRGVLDALGLASVHLFGHSMGGRNALVLAANEPSRIRSLVLGDIGPDENAEDIEGTRRFFEGLPDAFPTTESALDHWRERKPGYSQRNLDLLMRNLEQAPDGTLRWRFSKHACIAAVTAARSRGWWEFLPRLRCPVLLLHVEGSTELSEPVSERMRQALPQARYVRIARSGHNFHLENPQPAAAEIERFVRELETATSP